MSQTKAQLVSGLSINASAPATAFNIDASGRVGIGVTPAAQLDVKATSGSLFRAEYTGVAQLNIGNGGNSINYYDGDTQIFRNGGGTERARIDSSGRLLVGTTSSTASNRAVFTGHSGSSTSEGIVFLQRGAAASSGNRLGDLRFSDTSDFSFAGIAADADGTVSGSSKPGRLVFSTTADGASSPTERMKITSSGVVQTSQDGLTTGFQVLATNGSFAQSAQITDATRAANSAYNFYRATSGGFADNEFILRGDGTGLCDGSWTGGGADYAEYFEWSDNNPDAEDRRGISVILDGEKIRPAVDGEDPIGVISGNPSVVGDAAWNKWSGKYLRDDYGSYILDSNGERQLNPAYDPDQQYVNREDRPEWDCVGLMGKLRIRKGQPTGSRWIKMRDISDSVEEWLVR